MRTALATALLFSLLAQLSAVNPAIFAIMARNLGRRNPYNPYNPFSMDASRLSDNTYHARRRKWHTVPDEESAHASSMEETSSFEETVKTEASVEGGENVEEDSTEGLFMRKIVMASGAHIVRDSWCLVSDSNNCIPAL